MRVLNPGPGEIVDRLTVVARKIIESKGAQQQAFVDEMTELFDNWEYGDVNEMFARASYLLAATNAAIWQLEDEVRSFRNGRPPGTTDFSQLAFRIQELNDKRAKLVGEINAAVGINHEEKL